MVFCTSSYPTSFFPSLLFAVSNERQTLNDIANRFIKKASLSPKKVIVLIKNDRAKVRTKLDNIISEALQSAITSHATLASREMVAEAQSEIQLNEEFGQYRFSGTPVGRMKSVDYFVWAKIETVGPKTATIKLTLLNVKTHIVESYLAEDIPLQPTSMAPADLDLNLYGQWLEEKNAAYDLRISGMWETGWTFFAFALASSLSTCTKEELVGYADELDCAAAFHPTEAAFASALSIGIVIGATRWIMGASREADAENYRIQQGWPEFTLDLTPREQKISWAWAF